MTTIQIASLQATKLHKQGFTPSFSVKAGYSAANAKFTLLEGKCEIKYMKKDKTIATRNATLNSFLMPEFDTKKVKEKVESKNALIHYFDLDKEGWRCCKSENLISITLIEKI